VINVTHVFQDFLKSRSLALSGKKAELTERIAEWLDEHP
jgi:SAP domain